MNRVVLASVIIGIIISISSVGFYVGYVDEINSLTIPEDTNFTLYVSNQSTDNQLVNIQVMIDDKMEIDQDFDVGNQHQIYPFYFELSQGEHVVQIDTEDASHQKKFTIDDKLWIAVAYWYDKDDQGFPMITVDMNDGPIGFQ